MKTCPECAEQVQEQATVCRFCRHKFGPPRLTVGDIGKGSTGWTRKTWLVVGAVMALALVIGILGDGESKAPPDPAKTAEYERIKAECMVIATNDLDRRYYRVGGQKWADLVNSCMVKKAVDAAP